MGVDYCIRILKCIRSFWVHLLLEWQQITPPQHFAVLCYIVVQETHCNICMSRKYVASTYPVMGPWGDNRVILTNNNTAVFTLVGLGNLHFRD